MISNILGDDSNHTVANVINNTLNSVVQEASLTSAANPADGLLSQGYLLPQLMQVKWNIDGVGKITPGNNLPVNGGNFNQSDYNSYVGSGLGGKLTNGHLLPSAPQRLTRPFTATKETRLLLRLTTGRFT